MEDEQKEVTKKDVLPVMKKILFFIHNMEDGGAQKVLTHLVNNMDPEKFDITVLALFGGGVNEQFLKPHIRYQAVFPCPFPGNSRIQKLFTPEFLHRFCVREHYDIEVSYLEGVSARIISGCRDEDTKLACWIHSTLRSVQDGASCFRNEQEARKYYGRFSRIICVSQWTQRAFRDAFANVSQVDVLYNTVESDIILEKAREKADRMDSAPGVVRLISVGSMKPVKGYDRLIRVHDRLNREGYPLHTYLLGQGPDLEKLRQQAADCGQADSITFLGFDANPYRYIQKSDLFVCSSHSEGFSTAVTEALIVGTPVCTVEVSGMKEMLGEYNEWGVVTDNDEDALYHGIRKLLDDPALLAHYKEKADRRGKMFSTDNTVRAVEQMLLSL